LFKLNKNEETQVSPQEKIERLSTALAALVEAVPAYRLGRVGSPHSAEREKQALHITAEDAARAALEAVKEPVVRLACPNDVLSATGSFDAAGYDANECAGCGRPKADHVAAPVPPETQKVRYERFRAWWLASVKLRDEGNSVDIAFAAFEAGRKHKSDDPEIVKVLSLLHDGEPSFLIRAVDPNACVTINDYLGHCFRDGCSTAYIKRVTAQMREMGRWQTRNKGLLHERAG
jgi:hypothetical protein